MIIEDCVGSRSLNDKALAIERMRQEGAIISTYESILFELLRFSGTDVFKKNFQVGEVTPPINFFATDLRKISATFAADR